MIKKTLTCATAIAASAILLSANVAQANPATPMAVVESSAAQLCSAISAAPTKAGVAQGLTRLQNQGLDSADGALAILIAIGHVCPQHEDLVMNTMAAFAGQEGCTKPT
ncbi:hypothetical protein [Mycobacterium sp. AZCC_0083]|uniref:hypothetical protein n=1 Tax=Mycobacterium sp. AZCC_0083 TaxID=2735882 RepID=UPI00160BE7F9|nr:hypothetical protein [Mycobacterium sp. AZCC_0083]MBB5167013.1 hypothetical protein [Mycobacterium sp. AZCC_0083]